jgi:thiamine pyrophosphokinase
MMRDIVQAMKALICLGGEAPEAQRAKGIIASADYLIAADSGLLRLREWGLRPHLITGDMDSIGDEAVLEEYPQSQILRFPRDKDESDAELCLRLAWERGCERVAFLGGGGGRLDHLGALLGLFERVRAPEEWYLPDDRALRLDGRLEFEAGPGERVSIMPLGAEPLMMKSEGLHWPLDGLEFPRGFMSLSNRAEGGRVVLETLRGRALVLRPYQDGE